MRLADGEREMRDKVSVKLCVAVGLIKVTQKIGETLAVPVAVPKALQLECAGQVRPRSDKCTGHSCSVTSVHRLAAREHRSSA